jgi:hypothetical protein
VRAAARGALGGEDFGEHAAAPDVAARAAGHFFQLGVAGARLAHQRRGGFLARVGGVEAGLVGHDDEGVGFDQVGDQRAQGVVVAKADFFGGDGVVFVDDGDDVEFEQGAQGRAGVEVAAAIRHVFVREQHLRGVQAVAAKAAFVHLYQAHLADGGGGL